MTLDRIIISYFYGKFNDSPVVFQHCWLSVVIILKKNTKNTLNNIFPERNSKEFIDSIYAVCYTESEKLF